jgi:hypothetical protein
MIPLKCGIIVLTGIVLGACASSSELPGGGTIPVAATAPAAAAENAGILAEATVAEATVAEPSAAETAAAVAPTLTVDANQLAQLPTITCREVLKPGSNVIITACMTRDAWRAYDRREAQEAQELVRMMQGGRYR